MRNYFCPNCLDTGTTGFLDPEGWLAGEIEGVWFLDRMILRVCSVCLGDCKNILKPPPPPPSPPKSERNWRPQDPYEPVSVQFLKDL